MPRRNGLRSQIAPSKAVITTGEIFANGAVIELASGRSSPKPDLLLWNGNKVRIAYRVNHNNCTYEAPELSPSIFRATRFPRKCGRYASIRDLFDEISDLFARYPHCPDRESRLLAFFGLSTWLADSLPTSPALEICGDQRRGLEVLRLLHCVCRHPLLLGEITAGGLLSLPLHLRFTFLINQSAMTPRMRRMLCASAHRDLYFPNRGVLLDLFGPKAVALGVDDDPNILGEEAIRVFLEPAPTFVSLNARLQDEIASHFQPRLLMFRLNNLARVRESQIDFPEFASPTRQLARTLSACLSEDRELLFEVMRLLRTQDQDWREQRASAIQCLIVEVLLGLIHQGETRDIPVHRISDLANALSRSRGGRLDYGAEETGWKLKTLGLVRHRTSSGSQLLLDGDTSRVVHRLARLYELPAAREAAENCPECTKVTVP